MEEITIYKTIILATIAIIVLAIVVIIQEVTKDGNRND